jgi:hypothetical protein
MMNQLDALSPKTERGRRAVAFWQSIAALAVMACFVWPFFTVYGRMLMRNILRDPDDLGPATGYLLAGFPVLFAAGAAVLLGLALRGRR